MSLPHTPTKTALHSNFDSILHTALDAYKKQTRQDLASHPLLPRLQTCDSPDAILTVLREQIPILGQPQGGDHGFTKWLVPTVNVLYTFSSALGEGIGMVFSPAKVIFAGICVLLSAAKDVNANQDMLINLFTRIECFFRRLEIYIGVPPTTNMMDIIVKIMVVVLSILASATKEIKRGRIKKYLRKLIGNTDLEDALRRLDTLSQEETQMASAQLLRITHSVDDNVVGVDNKLTGVDDRVQGVSSQVRGVGSQVQGIGEKMDCASRNQLRDSLLRWLSPPDPSTNHNFANATHHKGTAQWFFQTGLFSEWRSTGSLLWIYGKPGSGKSILCSAIIRDIISLRNARKASVAYFYFDFRDINKQARRNLLPSLLIQLSSYSESRCDILSRLFSEHEHGQRQPSDRAMTECLKEMLALPAEGPTYVIMDALDECPNTSGIPSAREEVLELVNELVDLHLPNLHICITSRPEFDIKDALRPLASHLVSLHDEHGQKQDIMNYVSSVVHSDKRMRRWLEEDKLLVIRVLSDKADGMFRWVFCQLEVLRQSFPSSVRHILEELPEGLDETYERILREIRKANQAHAHRLLQCLVVAVRPLRVEELAELLAFDFGAEGIPKLNPDWRWADQEEAVLTTCSSLIAIVDDGDSQIVQFSHFSVKEFLTSKRLKESRGDVSRYYIILEPAHSVLVGACLGVLLGLDDGIDRDTIQTHRLARYAAQHWVKHAKFGNVSSSINIKDGMKCLFDPGKPHFPAWVWIYKERYRWRPFMSDLRAEQPSAAPLYYAALFGLRDLAEHLLEQHPEDLNPDGGYGAPFHAAMSNGHVDVASLLLGRVLEKNGQSKRQQTPLHLASVHGYLGIGKWLVDHGADVNAQNDVGQTALHKAALLGNVRFAQMLLKHKAEVNARTISGDAPLHTAARHGNVGVMRLLLEYGADADARDVLGNTPSQLAAEEQRQEIVQLLSGYTQSLGV